MHPYGLPHELPADETELILKSIRKRLILRMKRYLFWRKVRRLALILAPLVFLAWWLEE